MTSKRKTLANERKVLKAESQDSRRQVNETNMTKWVSTPWLMAKETRYIRRHP